MVARGRLPLTEGMTTDRAMFSYHEAGCGAGRTVFQSFQNGRSLPTARSSGSAGGFCLLSSLRSDASNVVLSFFHSAATYWSAARRASFAESPDASRYL